MGGIPAGGYNAVPANFSAAPGSVASTWVRADSFSDTAPTLTLPNDGFTYKVQLVCSSVSTIGTTAVYVGIGTAATTAGQLSLMQAELTASFNAPVNVVIPEIVAAGQVLNVYVANGTANFTNTFAAAATGAGSFKTPCSMQAIRVA